jgi:hypothetical protein
MSKPKVDPRTEAFEGIGLGEPPRISENLQESKRIPEKVERQRKDGSRYLTTPRPKVYSVPIPLRLTDADRAALEALATQEGTSAAALVRRAVKELIRRGGK